MILNSRRRDNYPPEGPWTLVVSLIIGVAFVVLVLWWAHSYAQTFGGKIAFGGRPSAAIILPAPACASQTDVNSIGVGASIVGGNPLALAIVSSNGSPTVSGVSNGSQSFTLVGTANNTSQVQVSIWKLVAPVLGSQTVTASLSAAVGAVSICVLNFANVTNVQNFASTTGTSGPAALSISSAVGNMVIAAFASLNNFIDPFDDSYFREDQPGLIVYAFIGRTPGAATVNISHSLTNGNAWALALLDVIKN